MAFEIVEAVAKNTSMNRERYHASGREQDSSQKKVSVIIL